MFCQRHKWITCFSEGEQVSLHLLRFLSTICCRWSNTQPRRSVLLAHLFRELSIFLEEFTGLSRTSDIHCWNHNRNSPQKNLTWSQATRNSHKGQAETRGGQSQTCTSVFVCVCACVCVVSFKVLVYPIAKVYLSTSGSSANIPVFFWKYAFFSQATIQRFPRYCMRLYFWKYSCGLAKV